MGARLDGVLNVATVIACACVAVIAWQWADAGAAPRRDSGATASASVSRTFRPGDKFPSSLGISFSASPQTVVVVLSSQCQYCINSMPFYQTLAKDRSRKGKYRLVALATETVQSLDLFARRHGFVPDQFVQVARSKLPVTGTPTLFLVNRAGVVQHVWVGEQTPAGRDAIVRQLGKPVV